MQMPEWFVDNLDIRILDVSLCTHMLYMCVCVCVCVCVWCGSPPSKSAGVSQSFVVVALFSLNVL